MNWGNKLLITFILFGTGMTFLVVRSLRTQYELVEKDYYKQELRYQDVIDGSRSANALLSPVKLEQTPEGIILEMPDEMKNKTVTGNIWFYCAYDADRDRKFSLQSAAGGMQVIPQQSVAPGDYTVKLGWSESGKKYYTEKKITIR